MELELEYPLARHDIGVEGPMYEAPGAVVDERLVLVRHGITPVGIIPLVSRWILALDVNKILTLIERMTLGDGTRALWAPQL